MDATQDCSRVIRPRSLGQLVAVLIKNLLNARSPFTRELCARPKYKSPVGYIA